MDVESVFQASYERVIGSGVGITELGRGFFSRFYENFLSSSDEIKAKFKNTDMQRQVVMMQKGVYQFMTFYLTKEDNQFLSEMAKVHGRDQKNVVDEMYDQWLSALLKTVEELDPEFDNEVALAWKIVMSPGMLYMKHYSASR